MVLSAELNSLFIKRFVAYKNDLVSCKITKYLQIKT